MAAHVTLKSEAQAPLVRAVIDLTSSMSEEELTQPGAASLRTLFEGLLERLPKSSDPLAKARLRGLVAQRELLDAEGGGMTGAAMAAALGVSRQAVDKRRKAQQILAFETPKRGLVYPTWQLTSAVTRTGLLPGLAEVLAHLPHDSAWADARFFLSGNDRLLGRRPLDVLRLAEGGEQREGAEKTAIAQVVEAAEAFGEQGAA